jgi:protein Mpv17
MLLPAVFCFTSKRNALRNVQNSRHRRVDRTSFVAPITSALLAESDAKRTDGCNLYSRYMDLLDRRPFLTQSISAGIISALGDVLSQWIELKHTSLSLNWVRLIAFWVCGTLYVGPFVHLWYNQLWKMGRWMERKYQTSKRIQTLSQVIVDQTVGVAFFFPTYFYSYEYIEALIAWRGTSITIL